MLLVSAATFGMLASENLFAGNPTYNALVLSDNPMFFWTFDEPDGNAINLAEPIPENELIPQGNATRALHSEIGSGLQLGRAAEFDGENGVPGSFEATRFYAPDLRGDPTPGVNNDSPGFDFIESQLWAVEMWLQITGDNEIGESDRREYLIESFNGTNVSNDPGLIYDFNADELEMFGGGRTGPGNGSVIEDNEWHHVIFAFYGNDGGFGVADRQDIVINGEFFTDRDAGFSSGFGLQDFSLGATTRNLTEAFEGRIDELAIYDVGLMLLDQGFAIDFQNDDAEDAFEGFLAYLAESRMSAAMGEAVMGDYNLNGSLDAADLDLQAEQMVSQSPDLAFDLTADGSVNFDDRLRWVNDLKDTWIGDSNLDGEFNSGDLVQTFVNGKYETGEAATWEQGDWNGDQVFGSGDLVAAFANGGFEQGPRGGVAAVPEPAGLTLFGFALVGVHFVRRRS
jgi:hypothetical protein